MADCCPVCSLWIAFITITCCAVTKHNPHRSFVPPNYGYCREILFRIVRLVSGGGAADKQNSSNFKSVAVYRYEIAIQRIQERRRSATFARRFLSPCPDIGNKSKAEISKKNHLQSSGGCGRSRRARIKYTH